MKYTQEYKDKQYRDLANVKAELGSALNEVSRLRYKKAAIARAITRFKKEDK